MKNDSQLSTSPMKPKKLLLASFFRHTREEEVTHTYKNERKRRNNPRSLKTKKKKKKSKRKREEEREREREREVSLLVASTPPPPLPPRKNIDFFCPSFSLSYLSAPRKIRSLSFYST